MDQRSPGVLAIRRVRAEASAKVSPGLMLPRIAAYPADLLEIQDRYMRGTLPVAVPCSALGEFQATKEAGPIDLVI